MSLLLEAERYAANQSSHIALNAFISPLPRQSGQWHKQAKDADLRAKQGNPKSKLDGRLIAFKDNICTRDFPTTCASRTLETFTSPFDATVVQQVEDAGAIVAGKTNLDEFGMGSHSVNSHFGHVRNRRHLSAGGSSGGSAVAVATEQCYASLGTDTGGSIRLPAAYTGTVGFKPSYGLLSRWGVVAYANSLDTVGILAKRTSVARDVFDVLNKHDPRDPTSLSPLSRSRVLSKLSAPHLSSRLKSLPLRIGVPLEYNISELSPSVRQAWYRSLERLSQQGHTVEPVSLPMTNHALSAYYILAPAEASSNLAKYDGVRYGTQFTNKLYAKTRGAGFGPEVKRRIMLGAFSLSAQAMDNYFVQAQRIRRLVQRDFDAAFRAAHPLAAEPPYSQTGVDVLICPTAPSPPPSINLTINGAGPLDAYINDVFTVPASLAGLPAVSVPVYGDDAAGNQGSAGVAGIQVIGQYGDDELVLKVSELLEGCGL
ncbi:glutamyl-tRNA(Gln) amidotransferase subunit HER2 [Aspergillus mulundensis]|uniref:Glutamyl-tRNA(Gln) amidotransferase subunit A, mitochondrial n=1 Tax=Aspergillus mulundensis TaxID=1810919 RepID=A0A3D8SCV2_9EURO|nr:Glutamyl-tRNA(Gln) amidotransferase subunit A, mitochondrial [Aspergillus mulundensis]RDW83991.1 Glutamyl-tRNA(Gln) amidotransferase subunit A, mitochondrial [Aspergillus mulundensis]